jgi:hypothetical protein
MMIGLLQSGTGIGRGRFLPIVSSGLLAACSRIRGRECAARAARGRGWARGAEVTAPFAVNPATGRMTWPRGRRRARASREEVERCRLVPRCRRPAPLDALWTAVPPWPSAPPAGGDAVAVPPPAAASEVGAPPPPKLGDPEEAGELPVGTSGRDVLLDVSPCSEGLLGGSGLEGLLGGNGLSAAGRSGCEGWRCVSWPCGTLLRRGLPCEIWFREGLPGGVGSPGAASPREGPPWELSPCEAPLSPGEDWAGGGD